MELVYGTMYLTADQVRYLSSHPERLQVQRASYSLQTTARFSAIKLGPGR